MTLTQEQIHEVCLFQAGLSREEEWLFSHLAWVTNDPNVVTYEDKYEVMQKWLAGKYSYTTDPLEESQ